MSKSNMRQFRLAETEWEAFKAQAQSEGKTASALLKELIDAHMAFARGQTHVSPPRQAPKPAQSAPKPSVKPPKRAAKAPEVASDSPKEAEIDWLERQKRFSKPAQAGRDHKK